jgi:predicted metal-dependent phosphotriesterase family hydrolase
MRQRGHDAKQIDALIFGNPARFLGQSMKFHSQV